MEAPRQSRIAQYATHRNRNVDNEHDKGRAQVKAKRTSQRGLRTQIAEALASDDNSPVSRSAHFARTALERLGLNEHLAIRVSKVYELSAPPKVIRGFRDLVVRRATLDDVAGLASVDDTPPALIVERLLKGDIGYVGELNQAILSHTWLHKGDAFTEDAQFLARWRLAPGTVWSFNAAASPEARSSGLFVKVFVEALRSAFEHDGANRVQCLIRSTHASSIGLHEKLGFRRLGRVLSLRTPWLHVAHWEGTNGSKKTSTAVDGTLPELEFTS